MIATTNRAPWWTPGVQGCGLERRVTGARASCSLAYAMLLHGAVTSFTISPNLPDLWETSFSASTACSPLSAGLARYMSISVPRVKTGSFVNIIQIIHITGSQQKIIQNNTAIIVRLYFHTSVHAPLGPASHISGESKENPVRHRVNCTPAGGVAPCTGRLRLLKPRLH